MKILKRVSVLCVLAALPATRSVFADDNAATNSGDSGDLIVGSVQSVPKVFLPDMGIAGDMAYGRSSISRTDPRYGTVPQQPRLRDGQFVANSRIDPFADAQFTVDLPEGGGANVEEAWLYFNKLPAGLALKAGKFKPRFGLLDETDTFQLPMFDRPRAIADYLGDGLNATGMQLDFVVPNPWDLNLKAYLSVGQGAMLGAQASSSSIPLTYLATLDYARDLFETGSFELGASAAEGPSPYGDYEELLDPYIQIQFAPSQLQVVTWSVEGMFAQRHNSANPSSRHGVYTFIDYNFSLRYHLCFLADWVQAPGPLTQSGTFPDAFSGAPTDGSSLSLAPNFTWFVSGNTRLRIQYTHTTAMGTELADNSVALQATFSMGNLKQLQ